MNAISMLYTCEFNIYYLISVANGWVTRRNSYLLITVQNSLSLYLKSTMLIIIMLITKTNIIIVKRYIYVRLGYLIELKLFQAFDL